MQDLEENNRIVKSIDLFKKSGDTRGTLSAKIGTIKDIKVKELIEADEIKKRWQECTEELYKNGHNDQDRDDAGVTHIKPDILEYEVKWALGSITTSKGREGDENPAELFKISKERGCKYAAFNISANLENSLVATALKNVSFHYNPKER